MRNCAVRKEIDDSCRGLSYENLVAVYGDWAEQDEKEEGFDLGPPPTELPLQLRLRSLLN